MAAPLFGSVFLAMRAQMQAKQKKQINVYHQQLTELLVRSKDADNAKTLQEIESEMLTLLAQVMSDLDEGKFEVEDLQTFSFSWDKAIAAVRHRQGIFAKQVSD
jgi:hypothetical protein